MSTYPILRLLVVRSDPIKRNVKRRVLPIGPMPMFFSRHSAQPFERRLREWSSSGPEVVVRLRWWSGETVLSCGSISLLWRRPSWSETTSL